MTLQASGPISFADIGTELGLGSSDVRSFNDSNIRTLLGKASGEISLADAYGKTNGPLEGVLTVGVAYSNLNATYFYGWVGTWNSDVLSGQTGSNTLNPIPDPAVGANIVILAWDSVFGIFLAESTTGYVGGIPPTRTIKIDGVTHTLTYKRHGTDGLYYFVKASLTNVFQGVGSTHRVSVP